MFKPGDKVLLNKEIIKARYEKIRFDVSFKPGDSLVGFYKMLSCENLTEVTIVSKFENGSQIPSYFVKIYGSKREYLMDSEMLKSVEENQKGEKNAG